MSKPNQYIELGGKLRPIRFTIATIYSIENEAKKNGESRSFEEIASSGQITDMVKLLYHGLKRGAKKEKQPFAFEEEDVLEWLDDEDMDSFITKFTEAMTAFMPSAEAVKENTEESSSDPTKPSRS
jgi:hypothetical protein